MIMLIFQTASYHFKKTRTFIKTLSMKKTLVLAFALVAIFSLSATKKPAHPACGPLITFRNFFTTNVSIDSISITGPGGYFFSVTNPSNPYGAVLGTFHPTFVLHFSSPIHSGSACITNDNDGTII